MKHALCLLALALLPAIELRAAAPNSPYYSVDDLTFEQAGDFYSQSGFLLNDSGRVVTLGYLAEDDRAFLILVARAEAKA